MHTHAWTHWNTHAPSSSVHACSRAHTHSIKKPSKQNATYSRKTDINKVILGHPRRSHKNLYANTLTGSSGICWGSRVDGTLSGDWQFLNTAQNGRKSGAGPDRVSRGLCAYSLSINFFSPDFSSYACHYCHWEVTSQCAQNSGQTSSRAS